MTVNELIDMLLHADGSGEAEVSVRIEGDRALIEIHKRVKPDLSSIPVIILKRS